MMLRSSSSSTHPQASRTRAMSEGDGTKHSHSHQPAQLAVMGQLQGPEDEECESLGRTGLSVCWWRVWVLGSLPPGRICLCLKLSFLLFPLFLHLTHWFFHQTWCLGCHICPTSHPFLCRGAICLLCSLEKTIPTAVPEGFSGDQWADGVAASWIPRAWEVPVPDIRTGPTVWSIHPPVSKQP